MAHQTTKDGCKGQGSNRALAFEAFDSHFWSQRGSRYVPNKTFFSIFLGCLAVALLDACAYRNEGATDYRKSEIAAGGGLSAIGQEFAGSIQFGKAGTPTLTVPARNLQREEIRLVPLARKFVSSPAPAANFTDQDAVSVRLLAGYFNYYSEGPFSYVGDVITEGQFIARGELAIVVNVFQLGEDGLDFDFSDKGIEKGRVVYFSQDVQEGQFLNFGNMPVYGPVTFDAKPIAVDIAVMELDLSDQVTVDLLTELASLGGKAFPAAAPGLEILNSLGKTLVQKQTNDINLRYTVLFDAPEGGHPDLPRGTLEVGSYVFIRSEDRIADVDWENLLLDENTGQLYVKNYDHDVVSNAGAAYAELRGFDSDGRPYVAEQYRASNYLTFQVNKNESAAAIDLPNYDFGTFLDAMNKQIAEENKNLPTILDPIGELVEKRVQIALFDSIRSDLGTLARNKVAYDRAVSREAVAKAAAAAAPGDTSLTVTAAAAETERVQAQGVLLRQFKKTWKEFQPSLVGGTAGGGLCPENGPSPDAPENADETTESMKEVILSRKQCNYVLAKFEEIADVSDAGALKFFQADYGEADRETEICNLLMGAAPENQSVCA